MRNTSRQFRIFKFKYLFVRVKLNFSYLFMHLWALFQVNWKCLWIIKVFKELSHTVLT